MYKQLAFGHRKWCASHAHDSHRDRLTYMTATALRILLAAAAIAVVNGQWPNSRRRRSSNAGDGCSNCLALCGRGCDSGGETCEYKNGRCEYRGQASAGSLIGFVLTIAAVAIGCRWYSKQRQARQDAAQVVPQMMMVQHQQPGQPMVMQHPGQQMMQQQMGQPMMMQQPGQPIMQMQPGQPMMQMQPGQPMQMQMQPGQPMQMQPGLVQPGQPQVAMEVPLQQKS